MEFSFAGCRTDDHIVILTNNKNLNEGNYYIFYGIYNAKARSE